MGLVLGIDPGFASVGYALIDLLPEGEVLVRVGVLTTKKSLAKHAVYASDDNFNRSREIYRGLADLVNARERVMTICVESMSFPRNASAAAKVAMSWGILASFSESLSIPLVQISPQEVKKHVCNDRKASKKEVFDAVCLRYKDFKPMCEAMKIPAGQLEHPTDALATVIAALDSDVLKLARAAVAREAEIRKIRESVRPA